MQVCRSLQDTDRVFLVVARTTHVRTDARGMRNTRPRVRNWSKEDGVPLVWDWDWDWDLDLGLGTDASQVVTERVEVVGVGEQARSGLVLVLAAKGMTAAVRTVGFGGVQQGKLPGKGCRSPTSLSLFGLFLSRLGPCAKPFTV